MPEEMLDVIDPSNGQVLEQRSRHEIHREGLWHQVFHCLVVRPSAGSVVLQRRALAKAAFPGKLDLSATGHLEAGEAPSDGIRELREELGIDPDPSSLVSSGHRLLADDGGEGRNREVVHLFFLADDRPLADYVPDTAEVSGLVEVEVDLLLDLLADRVASVSVATWSPGGEPEASNMVRDDLVADTDGYWVVATVMARRFLDGESLLAI